MAGRIKAAVTLFFLTASFGILGVLATTGCLAREAAAAAAVARADDLSIYVSTQGKDTWRGDLPAPSADRRNGPVATLEAARDITRLHTGKKEIVLRGGDYYLERTAVFDSRDSGLRIVAAEGEQPVLHGGVNLSDWRQNAAGRWSAALELAPGTSVGDLFVDGERQTQARFPNAAPGDGLRDGWLFAARPVAGTELRGNVQFRFRRGDMPAIAGTDGLVAHIVGGSFPGVQWGSDTLPVLNINRMSRTIHTAGTSYFFTGDGSRYFLSGREEFLDAPGEWWFDRERGRIDYIPTAPGFVGGRVVIGVLPTLLRLEGVTDVTISGIGFEDGSPDGTGKVGTDTRGGGAVRLERADRVRLIHNVFRNIGVAIHVSESNDVVINGNEIAHTAGTAIYLGTSWGTFLHSDRALISNNRIRQVGSVYFESGGIWFQAANDVRIAHNLIEDTAQFGIAGGSIWGPDDACHRSLIEYNVVRGANRATADGGAIKLMGAQADRQDSAIRYNVVTGTDQLMNRSDGTFWPRRYENTGEWPSPISWAIYLDGRASGVSILGNLLRGNVAGIGINGGWSNLVAGNIIADGAGSAFRVDDATGRGWRPAWAAANRIERNAVLTAPYAARVVDIYAPDHGTSFVEFAENLFWKAAKPDAFRIVPAPDGSNEVGGFDYFLGAGLAAGDRIADPGFADPGLGDYSAGRNSAAALVGIDIKPLEDAGPLPHDSAQAQ